MKHNLLGWGLFIMLILLASASVFAFSISYEKLKDNTLELYPGQSYKFKVEVQNKEDQPMMVGIAVTGIASIIGQNKIQIPAKSEDSSFTLDIVVPGDAKAGQSLDVNYLVYPVDEGESPLSVRYNKSIMIKVVDKKPAPPADEIPTAMVVNKATNILDSIGELPMLIAIAFLFIALIMLIWHKNNTFSKSSDSDTKTRDGGLSIEMNSNDEDEIHGVEEETLVSEYDDPVEEPLFMAENANRAGPLPKKGKHDEVERELPKEEYFRLREGKSLKNLTELSEALEGMDDETFNHHVNGSKNDFAGWIAHLGKKTLAEEVAQTSSRGEMLKLIRDEIEG